MPNNIILSNLSREAYQDEGTRKSFAGFDPIDNGESYYSGLSLQTYANSETKELVVAFTGTDGVLDVEADKKFVTGGMTLQFEQALKYVNELKNDPKYKDYEITVTGHSLGGGIAQIVSHTFGLDGVSFEAPPASGVVNSLSYDRFIKREFGMDDPKGVGQMLNFTEEGSVVSSIPLRSFLGQELEFDFIPEGETSWVARLSPFVRLYEEGKDQLAQHSSDNFPRFFLTEQNINLVEGHLYRNGQWISDEGKGSVVDAETATTLNYMRTNLIQANEDLKWAKDNGLVNSNGELNRHAAENYSSPQLNGVVNDLNSLSPEQKEDWQGQEEDVSRNQVPGL